MFRSGLCAPLIVLALTVVACGATLRHPSAVVRTTVLPVATRAVGALLTPAAEVSPPQVRAFAAPPTPATATPADSSTRDAQAVRSENSRPGTAAWKITHYAAAGEIQGYAGAVSVNAGQQIVFYISTRSAGIGYRIDVFRMGWYDGLGARLMTSIAGLHGQSQGYYTVASGLVGCGRCRFDAATGLLDANWLPSYALTVPASWLSGVYLALLTDAAARQTYVPFVVRQDDRASAILVQASFNTYEAYNAWGGKSLYDYNSGGDFTRRGVHAAVKVSFDRPFDADYGSGQFLRYEYNLVRWLEREGYDVSYAANSDVDADPSLLLNHRAFTSAGHDEYWSGGEREHVQEALEHGVNLAFLSGDAVYWQVRYEQSGAGIANRTLVCYRGRSDPLWETDPAQATVRWQDPPVSRPENALTGTIYGGQLNPFVQDWVVLNSDSWLFRGTGLRPGDHVPGLVGKEYDRSAANGAGPPGLQVLSRSPIVNQPYPGTGEAESTLYTAPSGAIVFSAGTITWSWGLDGANFPIGALHSTPVSPAIQRLTANLLDFFEYGLPREP